MCSRCILSKGCEYKDFVCVPREIALTHTPSKLQVKESCQTNGVYNHDTTLCGSSNIQAKDYGNVFSFKPRNILTPKDVL